MSGARCFHGLDRCVFCWGASGQPARPRPAKLRCASCGRKRPAKLRHSRTCEPCRRRGFQPVTLDEAWLATVVVELLAPTCTTNGGRWLPVTPSHPASMVTTYPEKESPMGERCTSIESTVDAGGRTILRGDLLHVDGQPQRVAGIHRTAGGRETVILAGGLVLTANRYRLHDAPSASSPGDCVPCMNDDHENCGGTRNLSGCRCADRDHGDAEVKEPNNQQGETTMAVQPETLLAKLGEMNVEELIDAAKQLKIPYSGKKKIELQQVIRAKLEATKPAPKSVVEQGGKNVEALEKAGVPQGATAKPVGKAAAPKADAKPKADKQLATACEKCGYTFPKPRAKAVCNSETACKARQNGGGRQPRGSASTGGGKAASQQSKADAARSKVELQKLAGQEHKALQSWKKDGEKGPRPDTTNLDELHRQHDAKEATTVKAS